MRNVEMVPAMLALLVSMLSVIVEGTMYGETSISGALSHDILSANNCSQTSCYNGVPNTAPTSYGGHDQLIMSKSFRDRAIPVAYEVISDVNDDGLKSVIGAQLTRGPPGRGEVIRYGRISLPNGPFRPLPNGTAYIPLLQPIPADYTEEDLNVHGRLGLDWNEHFVAHNHGGVVDSLTRRTNIVARWKDAMKTHQAD
ncbi:hypothetical protein LTR49_008943 [Elasticomyces elasticus]|nr:hypothetical protein LTR49_008943 [Elasticomyces elasticus]